MAKSKIVIAELDIDAKALIESASASAKQIENLKQQQDKLISKGKETSQQFVANAAALKNLEAGYKTQQAAIAAQVAEEVKLVAQKKAVAQAVDVVNNSENAYIANNRQLIELKEQLRSTDDNYEKRLDAINKKLAENTNWLNQNGSASAKLAYTFNDYKQQVADSFNQINVFNGGLGGFISRAQEAGGTGKLFKSALDGMSTGIKGMGAAITANPAGVIIMLIVKAAETLFAVFKSFAPVAEKIEQVMAGVSAAFEAVKNAVIDLFTGAASLGDLFSNLGSDMDKAARDAMRLTEAKQKLGREMDLQEVRNKRAQVIAEEQMEIAKDETLSHEKRIAAFKKGADIEAKNAAERERIANADFQISLDRVASSAKLSKEEIKSLKTLGYAYIEKSGLVNRLDKEEMENLRKLQMNREDAIAEHKKMLKRHTGDLESMIKGFQADEAATDQKHKDDALQRQRDHEQKKQQLIQAAMQAQKLDLDLFIEIQGIKAKTLQEELKYIEKLSNQKIALAQAEYNASAKTANDKRALDLATRQIDNQAAQENASAVAAHAKAEMDLYIQNNKSVIDGQKELTAAIIEEERQRLEKIKDDKLEILAIETGISRDSIELKRATNEELTLQDKQYMAQKAAIEQEFNTQVKDNSAALDEQQKTRKAEGLQAERDIALAQADTEYEEKLVHEDIRHKDEIARLQQLLADKKITQEQYNKLEEEETKKTEKIKVDLAKAALDNKLSLASTTFGNMAAILGKESAAGKAMAVAQATIDTYKAATSAYASMSVIPMVGPALGAAAAGAAVAAGIANVKKITATKEVKAPKAERGALFNIGGNRHSAGGTMFTGQDGTRFEAEQGELIGVMNRNAARHFMAFNNAFPAGGSSAPNYFAGGGIVSREIAHQGLNTDELAAKIALANAALPAPVVAVQDIITQGDSYVKVRDMANF